MTRTERASGLIAIDVVTDGDRRPGCFLVPAGREGGGPCAPAIEPPGLVGPLETAVAGTAEQNILPDPQHRKILPVVAVDIQRIGADDLGQTGRFRVHGIESQWSADRTPVPEQRGWIASAGNEKVLPSIVIAIEDGYAAADEILPPTVIDVPQACRLGFFHEARRFDGQSRRGYENQEDDNR